MRRNGMITRFLLSLLAGLVALSWGTPVSAAQGSLVLTVRCVSGDNVVQLRNNTSLVLDLTGWTLGSMYAPQPDEPFHLSATVRPGASIGFFSGAARGNVFTSRDVFHADQPKEGARLVSPFGTLEVLCSTGQGTLTVALPGLPNTGGGASAAPFRQVQERSIGNLRLLLDAIQAWIH